MSQYVVHLTTTTSVSITVDVPDGLDPEEARDQAIERAYDTAPGSLCAHCSGWGSNWSRDEGEWELADEKLYGPAVEIRD